MLRYYFEQMPVSDTNTDNNNLFKGLKIMEAGEKYTKHKGRYPVVNLSLKSAKQPDWNMAYDAMVNEIAKEFERHDDVLESARLLPDEKELFFAGSEEKKQPELIMRWQWNSLPVV